MHHCALMDAVEFGVVDLIGVAQGRRWCRQPQAMAPDAGIVALAPLARKLDQFIDPGPGAARQANTETVQGIGLSRLDGLGR